VDGDKMYKVSEVAQIVGVSTAAIYKELKRVDNKFTTIDNGKKRVTEDGLRYFQERYRVKGLSKANDDIVRSLLAQLEEKDRQIAEYQNQNTMLIEQARNFQVLLKTEQDKVLLLAQKKPRLLQRLLRRKKDETTPE
jgi:predicted DNA-binding protein YlxM (UPF0122 family)